MNQIQSLHLVFGGELKELGGAEFTDPSQLHIVGIFPDYAAAHQAWSAAARATVDDAQMRYFIVPLSSIGVPPAAAGPIV
jgi:hypothetical protein